MGTQTAGSASAHRSSSPRWPVGGTLSDLVSFRAVTGPQQPFAESDLDGRLVTYGELRAVTDRWASLLDDLGVPTGATVGLAVGDPLDFALVFLGVLAAGRVAAPFDPGATDAELSATCGIVRPHLVVSDRPAPDDMGVEWILLPSGSFELADEDPSTAGSYSFDHPGTPDRLWKGAVVLSTSGTTGAPKLVRLDEARLLHTAKAVAAHHELTVADRGFNPLPLWHINAEVVGLLATLVAGSTVVLADRFHRRGFWATLARHRATWVNAVPAILARVVPLESGETVPSGIRFARSASSPLPTAVVERFETATGIAVVETYGMTEAASQITANPLHGPRKPGSVGRPVRTEVRIVPDTEGSAIGRVGIRGPSVIDGYAGAGYEDHVDADGWLETGDLGYFDDDGYLFLVGRADDVINRGGEKILPREVEEAILGEKGVVSAVVVGEDHAELGRTPVAYLVLDGLTGATEDGDRSRAEVVVRRVHERCTRLLSRPKRPVAYHVVESIPRGGTGKVRRRELASRSPLFSCHVR